MKDAKSTYKVISLVAKKMENGKMPLIVTDDVVWYRAVKDSIPQLLQQ
jgi:hypothetical protein